MEIKLGKRFVLKKRIGSGSFGDIYMGKDLETGEDVAIKLESLTAKSPQLRNESKVYRILAGAVGVPNMKWYGIQPDYLVLVMDLLGKSVQALFESSKHSFSLKTVLMLADQMISRIQFLHEKNIIHRDIKPDNFVVGIGPRANELFVIDMGLAKNYLNAKTREHIKYREGKALTGTARYVSINTHLGIEQSRRDDLEGIAYVLIYLLKGSLPWQGIRAATREQKFELIGEKKIGTPTSVLCSGLPEEFELFLKEVRKLEFGDRPQYACYREMFRNLMIKEGMVFDYQYDWSQRYLPMMFNSPREPGSARDVTPPRNCVVRPASGAPGCVQSPSLPLLKSKVPQLPPRPMIPVGQFMRMSPRCTRPSRAQSFGKA